MGLVKITTYKTTGKLNIIYDYKTSFPVWDNINIQKEAEKRFNLKNTNYTMRIKDENETLLNQRLILNQ